MNRIAVVTAEKHEFALFVESLSLLVRSIVPGQEFIISDEKLFHRILTVLRLQINDACIVFDQKLKAQCVIGAVVGKRHLHMILKTKQEIMPLSPHITFLLPLLKRDDFEAALYALAEVGVNTIQLVLTKKTSTAWSSQRDGDRAQRILISAAEQSKNYAIPALKAALSLEMALQDVGTNTTKIFFDPAGTPFFFVMQDLFNMRPKKIVLLIGPEGDLSFEEKKMVEEKGFVFCALTPTIVRAVQAAALGAGFVRSTLVPISISSIFK